MKTAKFRTELLLLLLLGSGVAHATWKLTFDADVRYRLTDWKEHDGGLHVAGLQVRKTFADNAGDRWYVAVLGETHDNFREWMLHECYVRYKGPLGKWNITAGRLGLPYGLLYSFSTNRLLYSMLPEKTIGFDADNGVMGSGIAGRFDWAVTVTQGYGGHVRPGLPGHGFAAARIGITAGDTEENAFGLSVMGGNTALHHHPERSIRRAGGGLDATIYLGQCIIRSEISAGGIDSSRFVAGFGVIDYALFPKFDLTLSGWGMRKAEHYNEALFTGGTVRLRHVTIRGGYEYAWHGNDHHKISFQLYRAFPVTF